MTTMKSLKENKPDFLDRKSQKEESKIRHFRFSVFNESDTITIPVCGTHEDAVSKRRLEGVTCPHCLKALNQLAKEKDFESALSYMATLTPNIIKPDEEIMKEIVGGHPSRKASLHLKAKRVLQNMGVDNSDQLPEMAIGSTPETFFKNMYEAGLINEDGDIGKYTAEQLAQGVSIHDDNEIII